MFKVGDKVRTVIHYNNTHWPSGYVFTITSVNSYEYGGICFDGKTPGGIPHHAVVLVSSSTNTTSNIQVGDTVSGTNPTFGAYTAKVLTIDLAKAGTPCEIMMISGAYIGFSTIENIGNLTLVVPPIPVRGANGVIGSSYAFSGGISQQWTQQDTADYMNNALGYVTSNNTQKELHKCTWKFYLGMSEKYEFCTSCDKKRDTDRWS